jgi:hypothetical protein
MLAAVFGGAWEGRSGAAGGEGKKTVCHKEAAHKNSQNGTKRKRNKKDGAKNARMENKIETLWINYPAM